MTTRQLLIAALLASLLLTIVIQRQRERLRYERAFTAFRALQFELVGRYEDVAQKRLADARVRTIFQRIYPDYELLPPHPISSTHRAVNRDDRALLTGLSVGR